MLVSRTMRIAVVCAMAALNHPAVAQQLENSTTKATSGTNGYGSQGRLSGGNLSPGGGPASETRMDPVAPRDNGRSNGAAKAGGSDATKELFEH